MSYRKHPIVKNSPNNKRVIRVELLERRALMAAVASVSPSNLGIGAAVNSHVQVTFASAMTASTITSSTFQLLDGATVLPGRLSYNSSGKTATLDSNSPLAYSHTYNVVVKGGASGVKDSGSGTLASDYTFSFTTAADPSTGAGGPILVITKSTNPYSTYYPEILRAEGLNSFSTSDISAVSAASLANYKLVILSEMTLTSAQVSTVSTWVNNGGKLIAMRPDKQLAGLLGLTDTGATINDTYLDIDNSNPIGSGLTATSMQYHSTADRYTLNGATSLAALFSNSTTSTGNPAVTMKSVGANGGQAAAFVFDLAKSVIQTRQGNPAWSGQERDGSSPIRSDDLFFGGASPDWVDLSKVAIPQADEQQRLLANMITTMSAPVMPLPRFWYFPNGAKAQVVMTGDDHNAGGTIGRWNNYTSDGLSGGQPIRGTSYVFPSSFTDSQGALYTSQGFEMGLHIDITSSPVFGNSGDIGVNWTSMSQLDSIYTDELSTYNTAFPSSPTPSTVRTHAIVWSDYDSQPRVEFSHRIRLDTNYYYWPGTWVLDRPGMFTGSGMPMRFAKLDGSLIDVYQAATQITDESSQTEPKTINALLDNATGANGYYGAFTVNAHTDGVNSTVSDAVIASAKAHNVPVITADALLRWTDGRSASNFNNMAWNAATNTLTFTQVVGVGASGLQAMVPMVSGTNLALSTITVNGNSVAFTQQNIKGINYAFYPATAGSVVVQYAPDSTPPVVAAKTPASNASSIPVTVDPTVTFNEDVQPATISIVLKDSANVTIPGVTTYDSNSRTATFAPAGNLSPNASYTVTVSGAKDVSNNTMAGSTSWTFTTAGTGPFNIWSNSVTPTTPFLSDGSVELGVKFKADLDGFVSGVRFYKGSGSSGTHTGTLWSSTGTQLATATFNSETATGWQTVSFSSPVAITAGTTYVASYHAGNGYAADTNYFSNAVDNIYLHALSDSAAGGNGLYRYGASTVFPNNSFSATNYWVDVIYSTNLTDTTPPAVVTRTPASGATNVALSSNIQAVFNEAIQAGTAVITVKDAAQVAVAGSTSYDANTKTATFTPTANLAATTTYTVTVTGAKDTANNTMASTSWSFTTATPDTTAPTITSTTPASNATNVSVSSAITATFSEAVQSGTIVVTVKDAANNTITGSTGYDANTKVVTFTPASALAGTTTYTITITGAKDLSNNTMAQYAWSFSTAAAPTTYSFWTSSTVPSATNNNDGPSIETGFKFSASVSGFVTGIRFYKGSGNTGTHIGNLWSSTGTLLAAATFSSESATGWQQVSFPTPVAITAGTIYVASYFSPTGTYNADPGYFATARDNGPIHALSNAESVNGLYRYTGTSAFPNSSFGSTNYWIDIVFSTNSGTPDTTPPTVTSTTPASGATNVPITSTLTASFNETVQLATINFTLKDAGNVTVPGTTTYNDSTHTATFTPSSPLNGFTTYTATVTGAKDTAGNTMSGSTSWSFTTATVDNTPPTVTATSPTNGATNISTSSAVSVTFSEAVQSNSIVMTLKDAANNTISGSTAYNSGAQSATFTPSSALSSSTTYTMTVTGAKDLANNTMAQTSFSFSTAAAASTYSFFTPSATPSTTNNYDGSAIEVGLKFSANAAGSLTGIRFYKGTQDTGAHIGNLWSSTGTLLATITFTGESASGWQQMNFSSPVTLTPGTTYVATYFSPTGRYSADSNYFTTTINNGPIHALSNTESPNGVYRYTASSAFPSGSFGASNYWVDVVFTPAAPADTTPPVVSSTTPAASATNVATNTTISAVFNEAIQSGTATYVVTDPALATIAGALSYTSNSAIFTPTSPLVSSTTYTVTLSGVKDTAGNTMATATWSFTTAASADTTVPTITSTTPTSGQTGVSPSSPISATFSEPVQAGTIVVSVKDAANNTVAGSTSYNPGTNAVIFTPTSSLAGNTTFTVTISGAKDLANNTMSQVSWSFTTAAAVTTWTQTAVADFTGTTSGTAITNTAGGEIQLAPAFLDDFNGTTLSANWTASANTAGSGTPATTVSGGSVSVGRQQIRTVQTFIDRGIEGLVTFNTANNEQFGLATDILTTAGNYGAYFTTKNTTNTLYARVNQNGTLTDVSLGALPSGAHTYAIYPVPTGFAFYVDGVLKTTVAKTLPAGTALRAALSSQNANKPIVASYVKILSFTTGGTYTSGVRDTGATSTWGTLNYNATLPPGTSILVEISTGDTATPDGTWSAWTAVSSGSTLPNAAARYIRYRITFITTDPTQTATLNDISIRYT